MYDFSVIMPVFNGEKFVEEAINSVALQNQNLEIIAVDDCSSDKSVEVLEKCKEKYKKIDIKIVKLQKNGGVSNCRNMALDMAKGRYIAFLDCDDVWKAGKLEKQLELMKKTNAAVCCTAREFIDFNSNSLEKVVPVQEKISYKNLLKHNSIAMSSAVVKAEVAKEFKMGDEKLHEDYIYWLNILKKYGQAVGINESYLLYRISENSKSGNKIKSAKMHYNSLISHGINPVKAAYLFAFYVVNGVIKHKM